jgi:LytR cell envelope-related transcriptional attenuator
MRMRGAFYGLLIVLAAAFGILAAGIPARNTGTTARIVDPPPSVPTSTTRPAPTTTASSSTTTTTVAAHLPAQVTVLVANGTQTDGGAAKLAKLIGAAGYATLPAVDAKNRATATTAVYFTVGYEANASALAALIGAPRSAAQPMPLPLPVASVQAANVLVVLGSDLAH